MARLVIHLQCGRPGFNPYVGEDPLEKGQATRLSIFGLPGGLAGKEFTCNVGDPGSILGSGRFPGEGNTCAIQYSGLENPMDCIVHRVTKSQTQLSNFTSGCI